MGAIELARMLLGDVGALERPAWIDAQSMGATRERLQRMVPDIDAGTLLRDAWDRLSDIETSRARVLLDVAVQQAGDQDDLRRLRSLAPASLVGRMTPQPTGTLRVSASQLADSHVHSGGAVPFPTMVDGLLAADAQSLVGLAFDSPPQDFGGNQLDVRPLVIGLKLALDHLGSGRRHGAPSGWSWAAIGSMARRGASGPELYRLWSLIDVGPQHRWDAVVTAATTASAERTVIDGLIVASCLLNVCLTTSDVASLEIFVDDFERYPVRVDTFRAAMDFLAPDLHRLELRKSFRPVDPGGFAAIRSTVRRFVEAATHHEGTVLQMPIGFLKRSAVRSRDPFYLDGQLRLAEQFAEVWTGTPSPLAREMMASVDVAGNEILQPNFTFVVAFKYLERTLRRPHIDRRTFTISAHAGEAYEHPLGGLRAVGEFVSMGLVVDRIGHALALDAERAEREMTALAGVRSDIEFALFDLVFARSQLRPLGEWRTEDDLLISALCDGRFGPLDGLTVDGIEAWYVTLFELDVVEPYRHLPLDHLASELTCPRTTDVVGELRHRYLHPGCVERTASSRYCSGGVDSAVVAARRHYYPKLRPVIVDLLRRESVVVEVCPTSNCRLGRFDIADHPIHTMLEAELLCSVSTDDPALFNTTLVDEYALLRQALPDGEIAALKANSLAATAREVSPPSNGYRAVLNGI